ncbi:MAG: NAD-dependent epimerase/dehydratase family protein [Desulfobacterales bacterium]|nr:NAD-dependent epimerase/dehydratase family protein [Desulfobacterales bacterium]
MKKKVLVCGSTGFIGRNIAEKLAKYDDLEVNGAYFSSLPLNHPNINPVHVDLTNPEQADKIVQGMDIIIQAAATTSGSMDIVSRPYIHVTDNAIMNSLVFRSAYEHSVPHVIFFSCTVMYQSSEKPIKESDFNAGEEIHSNYFGVGWTKVYLEKQCEFYSRLGRNKYTVIRHSNIYGPYDKFDLEHSHVFGATMTKVMTCKDGRIVVWGPGTEKRDLLYAGDLVDFVKTAIYRQEKNFELINVGYGKATAIKDLVNEIIKCSGRNITVEHDLSMPHIPTTLSLDISKAENIFGWKPKTSLEEGIKKTMEWYKTNELQTNR